MIELLALILFTVVAIGGLVLYSTASWGFTVFKFWGWFILPAFPVLPSIGYVEAMGLALVISLFKSGGTHLKKEYKDEESHWTAILLSPWITLLCGWLVKSLFL